MRKRKKHGRKGVPRFGMAKLGAGAEAWDRVQVEWSDLDRCDCRSLLRLCSIYYTIHIALLLLFSLLSPIPHHPSARRPLAPSPSPDLSPSSYTMLSARPMQPLPINIPPSSPAHLSPSAIPSSPARSSSSHAVPPSISLHSPSPVSTPVPTPTPQRDPESSGPSGSIPQQQEQVSPLRLSLMPCVIIHTPTHIQTSNL